MCVYIIKRIWGDIINNTALYAFRKYCDTVIKAAYFCCGNYAEAEDITQDVFPMLHVRQIEFEDDEHMKAWLLRAAINKCKNYKRSFRTSRTGSMDDVASPPSYNMDTTDIEVRELLEGLPKKYSAALFLHLYEGCTIKETAEILGQNVNTIGSLIRRGKEKLRLELTSQEVIS